MAEAQTQKAKNWRFIIGVLIMCVGMQIANYGTAVTVSGEINRMGAGDYYVLVNALGSLGMMLILPVVGRLTAILGLRNLIGTGILIQLLGRVIMIFSGSWVPYAVGYLVQSIGGGLYVSSAFVNMASAVDSSERAKFFGYIPLANAIGAIFGPMIVSSMYSAGGVTAKLAYILNLPVTLIGYFLIFKACSTKKSPGAAKGFDFPGLFMSVIGIGTMVMWLNLGGKMFSWVSVPSIFMAVLFVAMLVLLFKRETTIENPAVPLLMFKNKRLLAAFLCAIVASAYSTCSASYSIM